MYEIDKLRDLVDAFWFDIVCTYIIMKNRKVHCNISYADNENNHIEMSFSLKFYNYK